MSVESENSCVIVQALSALRLREVMKSFVVFYFLSVFGGGGELKKWRAGLKSLSDKMTDCVLCSGTGISTSDICTVYSRGGKKAKVSWL